MTGLLKGKSRELFMVSFLIFVITLAMIINRKIN